MEHPISGAGIMLIATAAALVCANTGLSTGYDDFWATPVRLGVGDFDSLSGMELRHWVNDGLMTLFFLLVSLEIKRELVFGHLSNARAALLPVVAALGGMVVPALIFAMVNRNGPGQHGWGIPMATDIVFAVAVLALFGSRVPSALRVFLLTLAVVDDLGGILVIAIFYNDGVNVLWLSIAIGSVATAVVFCQRQVRAVGVFVLLGSLCWYSLLQCGVHPTIAGVAFGLVTPAQPFHHPRYFVARANVILEAIGRNPADQTLTERDSAPTNNSLRDLRTLAVETRSPLSRVGSCLAPWVTFGIVPVFAFANAGVSIDTRIISDFADRPVVVSLVLALVIGKPVGIVGILALLRLAGMHPLPAGASWGQTVAVSMCGGIGFTVALFIGELAFPAGVLADEAKVGILLASLTATVLSMFALSIVTRPSSITPPGTAEGTRVC